MSSGDIILLVFLAIGLIIVGFYFLNKWAYKRMDNQQSIIERTKTPATIYVIDKKKDKITNVNMPKVVIDQMPKIYKLVKMRFVQAKIGPQIMTLMCDKKVYQALPVKKNVKVELAGIYIISMKGMKSDKEIKEAKKAKKLKEKEEKQNKSAKK